MLESFMINCYPLNRRIKVTINLPQDYNTTGRYYPVLYLFDGQNVYNKEDSFTGNSLQFDEIIDQLQLEGKEVIYITIASASNPERRLQEYKETKLANFITNSIHPYLKERYRMNNYIYSLSCGLSTLNNLALANCEDFKGFVIISPEADIDEVKKLKLPADKLYYIYTGTNEINGCSKILTVDLKKLLPNAHIVYDDNHIQ